MIKRFFCVQCFLRGMVREGWGPEARWSVTIRSSHTAFPQSVSCDSCFGFLQLSNSPCGQRYRGPPPGPVRRASAALHMGCLWGALLSMLPWREVRHCWCPEASKTPAHGPDGACCALLQRSRFWCYCLAHLALRRHLKGCSKTTRWHLRSPIAGGFTPPLSPKWPHSWPH